MLPPVKSRELAPFTVFVVYFSSCLCVNFFKVLQGWGLGGGGVVVALPGLRSGSFLGWRRGRCRSPERSSSQGGRVHFCTGTSQPHPLGAMPT